MTMTVRELTKWLSDFYDQDAQVQVIEEKQDFDGEWYVSEYPVDVHSNVRYSRFLPRGPDKYGNPSLSFLTFGNTG